MNGSAAGLADDALLDNPIWNSLAMDHAHLAMGEKVGRGLARRYPSDIGPLSGLRQQTSEAFTDLAAIVPRGDVAVLFLQEGARLPQGWQVVRDGVLVQMVCPALHEDSSRFGILSLDAGDFPEMVALASLTEPGPFRANTATLGGFLGIRIDGRLAAMAGRRLSPAGFSEISAVCTHPDFRGRGYAQALVAAVARNIFAEGRMPFLTSFEANVGAIRIYRQLGFVLRRRFQLAVLQPPAS